MKTTKSFDCVEMKQHGADRMRRKLTGMTLDQEIEYWRQRSEQFQREQDRLNAKTETAPIVEPSLK